VPSRSTKRASAATTRATDRPGDGSPFALGLLLRRAHQRASTELVEAIRPLGLELRHFAALIELTQAGPTNQRDLGAAIGMDKAMVVRVVDDLERMGLVVRQPVPGDRRLRNVALTEHGHEVFDAAHAAAPPIAQAMVAHLGPGEYDTLLDLLTRFTYPPAEQELSG
jgi:MarR family transcriptional regulator, lower aerobic nicotinate degradation pathway regulator